MVEVGEVVKKGFVSLLAFATVTVIVTEALQSRIYFSLFVGIPAGLVSAIIVFIFLNR